MISVSLSTLVIIYIIGLGGTILLFWFLLEKLLDTPKTSVAPSRALLRCNICLHTFVDNTGVRYIRCPVCSTLLDRQKNHIPADAAERQDE
jgi:hypothetical protein